MTAFLRLKLRGAGPAGGAGDLEASKIGEEKKEQGAESNARGALSL